MRLITTFLIVSAIVVGASAQSPDKPALAQKFAAAAKANAGALKQYTWQMRVQATLKGEQKPAKLYAMRFDIDGKVEKTELTAEAPPAPHGRGLRDRIKEKKIVEAKEWAGELADLVKDYIAPSPAVLQTFFGKSTAVEAPGGLVQIFATGVISSTDKMVYEITPDTQALKRFMFHAMLEGDPVEGEVQFATLPNGPNYAARTTVNVPAKQLSAVVENFQYVKQ
jgi:hypothetical protein